MTPGPCRWSYERVLQRSGDGRGRGVEGMGRPKEKVYEESPTISTGLPVNGKWTRGLGGQDTVWVRPGSLSLPWGCPRDRDSSPVPSSTVCVLDSPHIGFTKDVSRCSMSPRDLPSPLQTIFTTILSEGPPSQCQDFSKASVPTRNFRVVGSPGSDRF